MVVIMGISELDFAYAMLLIVTLAFTLVSVWNLRLQKKVHLLSINNPKPNSATECDHTRDGNDIGEYVEPSAS